MRCYSIKVLIVLMLGMGSIPSAIARDTAFNAKHAAIIFPYPMYKEKWRSSIGLTLLTTPEEITEELRQRIPCGEFHLLRRINNHLNLTGKISFQVLQNHIAAGFRYVKPINDKFYFSVGDDIGYWFGFLRIDGFKSRASGLLNYPNASLGYKTAKDLLITLKAQASVNLHYEAAIGENQYASGNIFYNGEAITLALEQPFYNQRHLTLAFSAINNFFYWQTWALFYKTKRKVFYPQITVGFIL